MPVITTYVCDNCKFETTDDKEVSTIGLFISTPQATSMNKVVSYRIPNNALWCQTCLDKYQISSKAIPEGVKVLTTSERLVAVLDDFVSDIVIDNLENQ